MGFYMNVFSELYYHIEEPFGFKESSEDINTALIASLFLFGIGLGNFLAKYVINYSKR